MWSTERYKIEDYKTPVWAQGLNILPEYKMKLAHTPTPVHSWHVPGLPDGIQLFVKRDDMTGSTLTGNKVRKLEFVFADAIKKGCSSIITVGAAQSNHVRTAVLAARQAGLESHVILRSKVQKVEDVDIEGNLLLDLLGGAHVYFIPDNEQTYTEIDAMMMKLAEEIKESTGETCYTIPRGGTTLLGHFGYFETFTELLSQGIEDNITDMVVATGSGGTITGLAIANYLALGDKIRLHGLTVSRKTPDSTYDHIDQALTELGLDHVKARDIVNVVSGLGSDYAINTKEESEFIHQVCVSTGVIIDGTYTGKAVYGMVELLKRNPQSFKGHRVLFIHTGGIFGALTKTKAEASIKASDYKTKWKIWRPS